jgi:DNA-binding winged helix-turn-helix (wHTH) protein/tetratricopeptide (TPR) repeat protein
MLHYQFSQFYFDVSSGSLITDHNTESQHEIQLRHKVANLLAYLITHRERVVSKEELLKELWQHGDYRENSLTQSIRELRAALGDTAKNSSFIKTYPQRGYQWVCQLVDTDEDKSIEKVAEEVVNDTVTLSEIGKDAPRQTVTFNYKLLVSLLCLVALIIIWYLSIVGEDTQNNTENPASADVQSLLVLPFINATDNRSMAWLELGLADMLAVDIQRNNQLKVTPPAIANALLLEAQLPWPTLPVHIRSLLKEHQIQVALFASVRMHKEQQVLDFQLIYANGNTQQGSMSYPSLPGAARSIKQQLLHLLVPQQDNKTLPDENPIAALALAEGMQALQKEGALTAKKYFQASLTLNEVNQWTRAYLARSYYTLGDWQGAEQLFANIPVAAVNSDPSLAAFIQYWRAELAFRRGDIDLNLQIDNAVKKAELAVDSKQMALSYRLKAKVAWQNMDWSAHQHWITKADRLFGIKNDLSIAADKLFYLGNPTNVGLEVNPGNDLQKNQQYLIEALNFYQQLNDQSMIAASQFAIAQNYTFALHVREKALNQALRLYRQLKHPYELAMALIYAGFYQMQLHDGVAASRYFSEAKNIAVELGAQPLVMNSDFYLAFANLDQGLDQRALGRHGTNEVKLNEAISQLEHFIENKPGMIMTANALVFLGWANTELGHLDLALLQLTKAKDLNEQYQMPTTYGYSSYSIMRIHLERGDYDAVINMADELITTRLQASFLARAFYEKGDVQQAIDVLKDFKQNLPRQWQTADDQRLTQYRGTLNGEKLNLGLEPKAHLIYCESDWEW